MSESLEFWYRRKFNLAPTDPRFLDATTEQIEAEYWAHHYFENPNKQEAVDDDFNLAAVLQGMEDSPDDWEPV